MSKLKVAELAVYPVKSCAHIMKDKIEVGKFGLENDRRWMVVDENGVMLTQRVLPSMCLIRVSEVRHGLTLNAPGMSALTVITKHMQQHTEVKVWDDICSAFNAGDDASSWLTHYLGINARLVYFPDNEQRQVDPQYARSGEFTAFSDGFPILLLSQSSMDKFNQKYGKDLSIIRFRPNLVVAGCEPHAEDSWKKIRINNIDFRIVKPCSRCVIPGIDPDTGLKDSKVINTLTTYRKRDNKVFFGQNVIAEGQGIIETGMPVEIIK